VELARLGAWGEAESGWAVAIMGWLTNGRSQAHGARGSQWRFAGPKPHVWAFRPKWPDAQGCFEFGFIFFQKHI
jgi:hypothetical protein